MNVVDDEPNDEAYPDLSMEVMINTIESADNDLIGSALQDWRRKNCREHHASAKMMVSGGCVA